MEQAYSEMFLAEPEPKFRLSRQHLCCHSERNQAYGERHSLKMDKKLHRPSARIYITLPLKRKEDIEELPTVCLIGQHHTSSPYYRGFCVLDKDFWKFLAQKS